MAEEEAKEPALQNLRKCIYNSEELLKVHFSPDGE